MTPELSLWWPIHWSRAHPTAQVPYPLLILWHYANILPRA